MQSDIYKKMLAITNLFFVVLENDVVSNSELVVAYVDNQEDFYTDFALQSDYDAYARRLGLPKFNDLWGLCLVYVTDETIEWLLMSGAGLFSDGHITRAMYTGMQMDENGRVKYRILEHCAKTELGVHSEWMAWMPLEAKSYEYLVVRFFNYFWNFVCALDSDMTMYISYIKQIKMILEQEMCTGE